MASINKIKVGDVLYEYNWKGECWPVKIIEINLDIKQVYCSWNNNPPHWIGEYQLKRYRYKRKKL